MLGLLATPSAVWVQIVPASVLAFILIFIARPAAVWLTVGWMGFRIPDLHFLSWVGLRGAVPIVLALFPIIAGVDGAIQLLHITYVVVLISLVFQGSTIGWAARKWAAPNLTTNSTRQGN